jgi:hypothetical protein
VDTVGGHFQLGAALAWAVPFGSLEPGRAASAHLATGAAVDLDLGLGVSRTTVLGINGGYARFSETDACPDCSPSSFNVGAFVRYHLVQGLTFDPWMSAGIAFRRLNLDEEVVYAGLDWADFRIGGDWYPSENFGFGPVIGLTLTSYLARSDASMDGIATAARFTVGARVVFDAPGK